MVKKNEELKNEVGLMKSKVENIDSINDKFIEKYEASKKKSHVIKRIFINLILYLFD